MTEREFCKEANANPKGRYGEYLHNIPREAKQKFALSKVNGRRCVEFVIYDNADYVNIECAMSAFEEYSGKIDTHYVYIHHNAEENPHYHFRFINNAPLSPMQVADELAHMYGLFLPSFTWAYGAVWRGKYPCHNAENNVEYLTHCEINEKVQYAWADIKGDVEFVSVAQEWSKNKDAFLQSKKTQHDTNSEVALLLNYVRQLCAMNEPRITDKMLQFAIENNCVNTYKNYYNVLRNIAVEDRQADYKDELNDRLAKRGTEEQRVYERVRHNEHIKKLREEINELDINTVSFGRG